MSSDEFEYDRRSVLKATAGTVAAVGGVGVATAETNCDVPRFDVGDVVEANGPDGYVFLYEECESLDPVAEIENGVCGEVLERCCFEGEWRYYVDFDGIDRALWVREPVLTYCDSCEECGECGDPLFEIEEYVQTNGPDGFVYVYEDCEALEPFDRVENGICGYVVDRCCFEGEWRYLVRLDGFDREVWIREPVLTACVSTN